MPLRPALAVSLTAAAALVTAAVSRFLVVVGYSPLACARLLQDPATWHSSDPTTGLLPVVALAAWACAAWLAAGLSLSVLGTLPGTVGQVADAVARRVTPAAVRRIGRLAVGATLVTGAVGASLPASAATTAPTPAPAAGSWTDLDWPGSTDAAALDAVTVAAPATAPGPGPTVTAAAAPLPSPTGDLAAFGSLAREDTPAEPPAQARGRAEVVVVRGDTLWSVAASTLGPDADDAAVAEEWQRWYSTNRAVIGADPDLLLPGQRLLPPGT